MDGESLRFSECGMPFGGHCLHETPIASKKDRTAHRLGGTQGCTVLLTCLGHMLSHAASLLCILLRKLLFHVVFYTQFRP
jgi:hypothetical protein